MSSPVALVQDRRPPAMLISGQRGVLGRAMIEWMAEHHPEVKIVFLTPLPFDITRIHSTLLSERVLWFVNCAGLGRDDDGIQRPYQYFETNTFGVLNHLDMIRQYSPQTRYLTFGTIYEEIAHSHTPYPSSKRAMRELIYSYRATYGLHATIATLGFTEYTNRADGFLSKKITKGVARIKEAITKGLPFEPIKLRDIDQRYCWTWAGDVAQGVWLMLNQEKPKDWMLSSGEEHTVREFVEAAFTAAGIEGYWSHPESWDGIIDERPPSYEYNLGGPTGFSYGGCLVQTTGDLRGAALERQYLPEARAGLGWHPKVPFKEIVSRMVLHDVEQLAKERANPPGPYIEPLLPR